MESELGKKKDSSLKSGIHIKEKSLVAECRSPTVIYYNCNGEFYGCFLNFIHTLASKLCLPSQKKGRKKKENKSYKFHSVLYLILERVKNIYKALF